VVSGDGTEVRRGNTYEQGENRIGEDRGGKETNRCPLTGTVETETTETEMAEMA
jgi:hypothetical protein